MVWQEQALKAQAAQPSLTPILTRTGHQYRTTWVKGVPISHKGEVPVHIHHHLGVEGRLAAYELVGPKCQLNVINVLALFAEATETFLEHLMEAYRQLAMMGLTVIVGDFNATPSADDRGGRQKPENTAVQMAMQHMGLQDLTASLRGQPSHRPPQSGSADSRIHLCYAGAARGEVNIDAHRTMPPRIKTYDPWLQPYGATSGHCIQQCTLMTRKPSTTPRTLPPGWTAHAGNSGSGTSTWQMS